MASAATDGRPARGNAARARSASRRSCRRSGSTTSADRGCTRRSRGCPSTTCRGASARSCTCAAGDRGADAGAHARRARRGKREQHAPAARRARADARALRPARRERGVPALDRGGGRGEYPRLLVDPFVGDFERDLDSLPPVAAADRAARKHDRQFLPARARGVFLGTVAGALEDGRLLPRRCRSR